MMDVIYDLIKKYDVIETDLKEDTSYLLYLMNRKLGYLEQIGEDVSYSFENFNQQKLVTKLVQKEILKNRKNPEQIMRKITFRKVRLLN